MCSLEYRNLLVTMDIQSLHGVVLLFTILVDSESVVIGRELRFLLYGNWFTHWSLSAVRCYWYFCLVYDFSELP